jgi:hypothetical protein
MHLMITVQKIRKKRVAITEYIRNVDRAILNMVFENTVRRVNNFYIYLYGPYRCVITKFGSCVPSNTTRQFIFTNTLYGQHVSKRFARMFSLCEA